MINAKFSANPESFKGLGRGRRIGLEIFHGYTHISTSARFSGRFHKIWQKIFAHRLTDHF
jgi:hypothetical protein